MSYGLGKRFRVGRQFAQRSVDRDLDLARLAGFVQRQVQRSTRVGVLRRTVGVVVVLLHLLVEDAVIGKVFLYLEGKEKGKTIFSLVRRQYISMWLDNPNSNMYFLIIRDREKASLLHI